MKIATAGFTCVDNYANLDNRHYPAGNGFDALVNLAKMGVEKFSLGRAILLLLP